MKCVEQFFYGPLSPITRRAEMPCYMHTIAHTRISSQPQISKQMHQNQWQVNELKLDASNSGLARLHATSAAILCLHRNDEYWGDSHKP